jgi:hypothetical protein
MEIKKIFTINIYEIKDESNYIEFDVVYDSVNELDEALAKMESMSHCTDYAVKIINERSITI